MSKRPVGTMLAILGVVLVAVGAIRLAAGSGDQTEPQGGATSGTIRPPSQSPSAEPSSTSSPSASFETPEAFLAAFAEASRTADADFFFSRLHPVVLDRYGAAECRDFFAAWQPDKIAITVRSVAGPETFTWKVEDAEITVDDVLTASVTIELANGKKVRQDIHLGIVGDELRWFTDCGKPKS